MSITLQGKFDRTISLVHIAFVHAAYNKDDATYMSPWDRFLDWCCGTQKKAALAHLHDLLHQPDPGAAFCQLAAMVTEQDRARFRQSLRNQSGKYFLVLAVQAKDGQAPLLEVQVEISQEHAAQAVMMRHHSFFCALTGDLEKFRTFYEAHGNDSQINQYITEFVNVMTDADAAIQRGGDADAPTKRKLASHLWVAGEYAEVFKRWPDIRRFVLTHQEHPAILQWEARHRLP